MTTPATLTVHCAITSRRGQHPSNEDAVAFAGWAMHADHGAVLELTLRPTGVGPLRLAVADGMGGRPAGATAARVATETLTRAAPGLGADDPNRLRRLFESADDAIRAAATETTSGLGCAAAYLEIAQDGRAVVANIGDVRVYQSLNGYLAVLTRDDWPSAREVGAAGRLTRTLGGVRRDDVTPHRFELQLQPGNPLFIITDGGYGMLTDDQLESNLSCSLPATVGQMAAAAIAAGTLDDVTVMAVELVGPQRPARAMADNQPPPEATGQV